jgi:cyclophilin family peptidyl-prolyl cis-trans isomerase
VPRRHQTHEVASRGFRGALGILVLGLAWGCRQPAPETTPAPSATAPPTVEPQQSVLELLRAEATRRGDWITPELATSHDVRIRRLATRAAARSGGASELLGPALHDEDPVARAWAAFGLARDCSPSAAEAVTERFGLAAADLAFSGALAAELVPTFSVGEVLGAAIADCGNASGERTLRAWLGAPSLRASASLGLSFWAHEYGRLTDETLVELLNRASTWPTALGPIAHLPVCQPGSGLSCEAPLNTTMSARLVLAAEKALASAKDPSERVAAVKALARGSERGARVQQLLTEILLSSSTSVPERTAAAHALQALGAPDGTWRLVLRTLGHQIDESRAAEHEVDTAPLSSVLALIPWSNAYTDELVHLAELPVAGSDASRRRIVQVRCEAARVLAHGKSLEPRLVACDTLPGEMWEALATLRVLAEEPIVGERYRRWQELSQHPNLRVQHAALELLGVRPEVPEADRWLTLALVAEEPGTVAVAARTIRRRVRRDLWKPQGKLQKLFDENFDQAVAREFPPDAITTTVALIELIGVTKRLRLRPVVERACALPARAVRGAAEKALRQLGTPNAKCDAPLPDRAIDSEVRTAARLEAITLEFEFDSGKRSMTLYPSLAPQAVARVKQLVETGFYVGQAVGHVEPGVAIQFGDPSGDGHGGAGRVPVPSEFSPVAFRAGSVGLAQAGPDTGSSQLFIALVEEPRLFGEYPWLGVASPGWDTIVEGDVIVAARVVP